MFGISIDFPKNKEKKDMTRTKNIARLLTLILVLCMVVIPFASCKQSVNGYCTVVVATEPKETAYKVNLDKVAGEDGKISNGLIAVLDYLKENEKDFTYESNDTGYGAFLTKVLTLDPASVTDGYGFITILTSVEKDFDVSGASYVVEKDYKGTKVVTSGLGASAMTIQDGAVYYIDLATY